MSRAISKVSRAGLAKYSPQKGLQRIAGAEVAERYYARAKDATGLERAIRAKLEAQAEFVFWWDPASTKAANAVIKADGSSRRRRTGSRSSGRGASG
ncbi:MAG: hypothetical protein Q7R30_11370 [Acidobacteriota bacterium]|nr:hypothetical protein [Acidobacteriota bacterium]